REQIAQDKIAALVWISLATLMPFAFSMRVAPVQIWWALKYHELEFDGIDSYISGASSGDYKYFGKKLWRTGALGRTDWYIPELASEANTVRQQYKQFDVILGSLGREEKLNNPEFVQVVATILQKYPKVAFLWTGKEQLASIQNIFEQYGVSQQCFFIGWVNTRLYAQVLDIFLDSFPFPCGFTTFETIAAAKPVVLYNSAEANEIGLVSNIAPVLTKLQGTEQDQKLMYDIFYPEDESLYFCAKNLDEYFNYACRLIEEPELRRKSGYANQQFIKYFFASIEKMAISYTKHFLEVIHEKSVSFENN
ncbi:MAG: hypothetical protein VSS52_013925, partial [Thiotrichaceae bacterium]|nr:hypothetical protein [Thiotrichaceae bacterium]